MKNFLFIAFVLFGIGTVSAQSKIAHLNSQEVMTAMPSYNKAVQKLETFQQELLLEFQEMQKDFQKEVAIYQEMVAKGESPTLVQIQEQKLAKKDQAIKEREQNIQSEIEAYSRELNLPIVDMVDKAVSTVANRNNYDYVFDVSTLMIHNGPDITKEVITEIRILDSIVNPPPIEVIGQ